MSFRDDLLILAGRVAEENSRMRIAFNEADGSTATEPEAAHFWKFDGKRIGRDIELWAFMASVTSCEMVLVEMIECVLSVPGVAFGAVAADFRGMAKHVSSEHRESYLSLCDELAKAKGGANA